MYKFMILLIILFSSISFASEIIAPIPLKNHYNKAKALLGKKLFFDTRLSKDNTIACVSCHQLPGGGADTSKYSFGVNGSVGNINSPTVLNSVYNFVQFWDGRATSLQNQVVGPIQNPVEMANNMPNVVKTLRENKLYKKEFKTIYKDGITSQNISNAISEFEKALTTPNARFDKYLLGNKDILNSQEKRGWEYFNDFGCVSCHNGINIGGNMYQKFGIIKAIDNEKILGRYNVTKREKDKYVFKVPTLRNIELTSPYFHDGSALTMSEAVRKMSIYQLGTKMKKSEVDDMVAFLKTLTGKTPTILSEN